MPSQPRSPSLRENAGSTPESQVSTWVSNVPAASSAARNSRTSARTCSAASDGGAGASVNELLLMRRFYRGPPYPAAPGANSGLVVGRRAAGEFAELVHHLAGHRPQRAQGAGHHPTDTGEVQA